MSKPRNWPYVQRSFDHVDAEVPQSFEDKHRDDVLNLARAFFDEPGSTEILPRPKWVPPHLPATPKGAASTMYSIFDWWFANYEVKDNAYGYWSYLYEWKKGGWKLITLVHGETIAQAFTAATKVARLLLIEGERPEAQKQSPELDGLVRYWQSHGQHALARDNPKLPKPKP